MEQPLRRSPRPGQTAGTKPVILQGPGFQTLCSPHLMTRKHPAVSVSETGTEHFIPGNRRRLAYFTGFQ